MGGRENGGSGRNSNDDSDVLKPPVKRNTAGAEGGPGGWTQRQGARTRNWKAQDAPFMLNGQQGDNADIMLISSRHKATNVMPTNDHYADDFAGHFAIDNAHLLVKKKTTILRLSVDFTHNITDRCQWMC